MIKQLKKHIFLVLLLIVFLFSFFLRTVGLSHYPVGFQIDEASLGYNAYSILKTGRSEANVFLPLYIDTFGDQRPTGYNYLAVPSIATFGLTIFATRLPGALFGALTVFPLYLLALTIFKNKKVALLSALFLAISPWSIVLSRASAEGIIALFFIVFGFACLFKAVQKGNSTAIVIGTIAIAFSFFFYHTPRVFGPLLFVTIIVYSFQVWKKYSRRFKIWLLSSFLMLSMLVFSLVFLVPGGTGRFSQVNIFSSFEARFQQNQQKTEDFVGGSDKFSSRILHNKFTNYLYMFTDNYLEYFSGNFLFTRGGLPIWYKVPRAGILLISELPFIIIGLYFLFIKKNLLYKLLLIWLFLGPVIGAITLDDIPNINRASVMFPVWEVVAAFGCVSFFQQIKKNRKLIGLFVGFLFFINFFYFQHQYYINANAHDPWYRNNGFKEMMEKVNVSYDKYDHVIISKYQGGVYPLILFYSKYDPATFQSEGSQKDENYTGFGKYFVVPQDCPFLQTSKRFPEGKRIFVEKGSCYLDKILQVTKHEYILREDGTKAFRIDYEKL